MLFNKCSPSVYLQYTWDYVIGGGKCVPNLCTILLLCAAHFIKSSAMSLIRAEHSKTIRKAALVVIAVLQRCRTLKEATAKFRAASTLFNSTHDTPATDAAKANLLDECTGAEYDSLYDDIIRDACKEQNVKTWQTGKSRMSIRGRSPYTHHFRDAVQYGDDSTVEQVGAQINVLYSPAAFNVISRLMTYYPLWSSIVADRIPHDMPMSNATVESHFRNLKISTLAKRLTAVRAR